MTDIVERLREYSRNMGGPPEDYLAWQAADEIERLLAMQQGYREEASELRIENERLREWRDAANAEAERLRRRIAVLADEIERLRAELTNREEQVARLKRARMWNEDDHHGR